MSRIAARALVSPRMTFPRSAGAVRFDEGHTRSAPQAAAAHTPRLAGEVHSLLASRLRMTITGVNASTICEISLRLRAVLSQITAAKARLARSDASRGSVLHAAAAQTPMT